ncbi:MAG TPA: DUF4238 domain-containing protein [Solirubrobacterales bacterium]|nr:DUF4238 domain-containing protein [Solirubrobacterales bacterium]
MKHRQRKRKQARRVQHARATHTPDRPALMISAADCPKVDNGHIVPRMYQQAWEVEGRQVAVHEPGRSECEVKSSKLVGARGPYYRRTRPHGTQIDDIEASLAHVENKATPALRQIVAGEPFTVERKGALAQFFGLQMMRGPAFFAKHEEIQRSVLEGAQASDLKPRHLAAVGGDVNLARSQVIDVLLSPTSRFMTMLSYAVKVAGILSLMRWHVVRFDRPLLAYSDHPVVLWPMNVERTRPFSRQELGPLTMLEIRVPIAPDAAILMNWIDCSDEIGVPMKPRAAAELNAFTVAQAEKEWMHRPGSEPEVADDVFSPLSRLIDPTYDRAVAKQSARRAHADSFHKRSSKRKWVNELDVVVDVGSQPPLLATV